MQASPKLKGPFARGGWSWSSRTRAAALRGCSACATSLFTRKIDQSVRYVANNETFLVSVLTREPRDRASCVTRPARFPRAGYARQNACQPRQPGRLSFRPSGSPVRLHLFESCCYTCAMRISEFIARIISSDARWFGAVRLRSRSLAITILVTSLAPRF